MSTATTAIVASPLRPVAGDVVPAAGTWHLDPSHTVITVVGRRLVGREALASFTSVTGSVVIGDDPGDSLVEVSVLLGGVSIGAPGRDVVHPFSAEVLAWAGVPVATFQSTFVTWEGGPEAVVEGDLTIDTITRPVLLDVEFLGAGTDPRGLHRAAFRASTNVDRRAWGRARNLAREVVDGLISFRTRIEIRVEMVHEPNDEPRGSNPPSLPASTPVPITPRGI